MSYIDRIKTENIKSTLRERIIPYVKRLESLPYIEGILLMSGLANKPHRNFMDCFSDIDVTVFIEGSKSTFDKKCFLPDFEFHIPINSRMVEVNIQQLFIADESLKSNEWDEARKEAFAYTAELVFDRNGEVAKLIQEKIVYDEEYRKNRLSIILSQYLWLISINPLRLIERGFLLNAMYLLNEGIELLIEGLYLVNKRYRPHPKWRIEVMKDLAWLPKDFEVLFEKTFITTCISQESMMNRRSALIDLFEQLDKKVSEEELFGNHTYYEYACLRGYKDRQTKEFYNVSIMEGIKSDDRQLFEGLINEYLINNLSGLKNIKREQLEKPYLELLKKYGV